MNFSQFIDHCTNGGQGAIFELRKPGLKQSILGIDQNPNPEDKITQFIARDFLGKTQVTKNFTTVSQTPNKQKSASKFCLKIKKSDVEKEKTKFLKTTQKAQTAMRNGDFWVINISVQFTAQIPSIESLFHHWDLWSQTSTNHAGGIFWTEGLKFFSFSPEIFWHQNQNKIYTYPIKGTGSEKYLVQSPKEIAELHMVTDLMRNDLGQILDHIHVEKEREIYQHGDLFHAQSIISGQIPNHFDPNNIAQILPAGSISGAPKSRVLEFLKQNEGFERQFFAGTFGIQTPKIHIQNILIRTIFVKNRQKITVPIGTGITIDSDPESEWNEILQKLTNIALIEWV